MKLPSVYLLKLKVANKHKRKTCNNEKSYFFFFQPDDQLSYKNVNEMSRHCDGAITYIPLQDASCKISSLWHGY